MTLPIPSPNEIALSNALLSQIMAEIKAEGSISFARYMELALYAPSLGYYRNGYAKFGKDGDFVTAPEISPLFSYCMANQAAQFLKGGDIIEFGAGSGVMAADILLHLHKTQALPRHYFIIEISAELQALQRETLSRKVPELWDRVVWLTRLPETPIQGVILANEVLDAMPVTLFSQQKGIKECVVTANDQGLVMALRSNNELANQIADYGIDFAEGYTSEVNRYLPGWVKSLSDSLSEGAVIIADYGFLQHEYYHPDRSMGTLMCHYRHHAHGDPFFYPGLQDITAHVDFTQLAENAEKNGFSVSFATQARFLLENHLLSWMEEEEDEAARYNQNQAILKLTSPNDMGELFKVMVLEK